MAIRDFYSDVDLKANQLFNSRLHNITTAARVALGIGLTTNDKGYMVYDTDLSSPYFWDGTQWLAAGGSGTTPNLQQVTDVGNITTNDIKVNSVYYWDTPNDAYGRLQLTDYSWVFTDGDNVIRASIGEGAIALKNKVSGFQFSIDGSNLTANKQYQMPNYSTGTTQVLPISVNGNFADDNGNITLSASQNLQEVTDVGNTTTNDIWLKSPGYDVGGGLNIGDSLVVTNSPSLRLTLAESASGSPTVYGLETYLKMGYRDLQSTHLVIQDLNGYDKFRFTTIPEYVPAIDFTNAMYISSDTSYDEVYSMAEVGFFSNRSTATSYLQLTHLDSTVRLTAGAQTGTLNTIALPNINAKTLAVSVNGNYADDSGNITITAGSSVGFEQNFMLMGA